MALCAASACAGSGALPAAFQDADKTGETYTLRIIKVDEKIWLGLPVLRLATRYSVRITGITINDALPTRDVHSFDMSLPQNDNRAITILEDKYFRRYGLKTRQALTGSVFAPGDPTDYAALSLRITRPGDYVVSRFTITYEDTSGKRHGEQTIIQPFRLGVREP